jgi:predicted transposase YdaD
MEVGMPKPWDDFMKSLVRENPQALVSFFLAGAVYQEEMDRELTTRTIVADGLYHVEWNGESIVLHVEFQRSRKNNMPRRVWEYNALTSIISKKPVYSVVIYLVKEKSITKPVYRTRFRNGRVTQWFSFDQIKLWELPPEMFEQPQLVGLLPLLPLTKNGQNRETVERLIQKMEQAGTLNEDTLCLIKTVTGLVLTSAADKEWLTERFKYMLDEILKESWVYQEISNEGLKEGLEKGLEQGKNEEFLQFVGIRFPTLLAQAKQVVEQQTSVQQLRTIFNQFYRANTIEEAQAVLLAGE